VALALRSAFGQTAHGMNSADDEINPFPPTERLWLQPVSGIALGHPMKPSPASTNSPDRSAVRRTATCFGLAAESDNHGTARRAGPTRSRRQRPPSSSPRSLTPFKNRAQRPLAGKRLLLAGAGLATLYHFVLNEARACRADSGRCLDIRMAAARAARGPLRVGAPTTRTLASLHRP